MYQSAFEWHVVQDRWFWRTRLYWIAFSTPDRAIGNTRQATRIWFANGHKRTGKHHAQKHLKRGVLFNIGIMKDDNINNLEGWLSEEIDSMGFPTMKWVICRMVLNGLIPIEKVLSAAGYSESEARTIINRWNEGAEPGIGSWIERLSRIPRNEVLMYLTKQK